MKSLFNFSEFGVPGSESITKHFASVENEHKKALIQYMNNHGVKKCTCGIAVDVITKKTIGTRVIIQDDKFSWTNDLIYYIDKYNLIMPDDFVQHVLNNS